jgi:hypothetical protein
VYGVCVEASVDRVDIPFDLGFLVFVCRMWLCPCNKLNVFIIVMCMCFMSSCIYVNLYLVYFTANMKRI